MTTHAAVAGRARVTTRALAAATAFPPLPEAIRKQADVLVVTLQLPER